ncbi:MAG: phosphatase PAP2 family protein, partial [Nitrospirae bacterium]
FFAGFFVVYGLLNRKPKDLALLILVMVLCVAAGDALSNTLKHLIKRPRPFLVLPDVRLLVGMGHSFAMPSGHATTTTAVATGAWAFLMGSTERRTRYWPLLGGYLLVLVLVVGFSRPYVGVHWVGDVLVGTILGLFTGYLVCRFIDTETTALKEGQYLRALLLFVIAVGLFRYYYIYTGPLRLSPDEAHYWDWSRTLQWSYYSKPPMVAYLIRLSTEVFGNTELGVRAWPPILSGLSSIVLYFFTVQAGRRIGLPEEVSSSGALLAGAFLQVVPVFATYGVIMTIDAPLIFFWSLALLVFSLSIERGGLLWGLLGLVVGLGMLTKFTMAFFIISAGLFFLMESSHRTKLKGPSPWV